MGCKMSRAGAFIPGPLGRTFSRVPLELITYAVEHGMPIRWGVLFYLQRFSNEDGNGNLLVCCARSNICDGLGITEKQARAAVSSLIRDGILSVAERGHNGRATVYRVDAVGVCPEATPTSVGVCSGAIPTEQLTAEEPEQHTHTQDGDPDSEGRGMSRSYPYSHVGVCSGATPNRTFEEGSIKPPSSEKFQQLDRDVPEGPIKGPEGNGDGYLTDLDPMGIREGATFADMFSGRGCRL